MSKRVRIQPTITSRQHALLRQIMKDRGWPLSIAVGEGINLLATLPKANAAGCAGVKE